MVSRRYCVTNQIREDSLKIIHCIYPENQVIKRFKKYISLTCAFCNLNDESIPHLFFECICTTLLWCDFNGFYNEMTGADIILEAKFFFTFNDKPLENLTTLFCS